MRRHLRRHTEWLDAQSPRERALSCRRRVCARATRPLLGWGEGNAPARCDASHPTRRMFALLFLSSMKLCGERRAWRPSRCRRPPRLMRTTATRAALLLRRLPQPLLGTTMRPSAATRPSRTSSSRFALTRRLSMSKTLSWCAHALRDCLSCTAGCGKLMGLERLHHASHLLPASLPRHRVGVQLPTHVDFHLHARRAARHARAAALAAPNL